MDRNLLLAVALSIAVYAAWFGFVDKRINPPAARPAAAAGATGAFASASSASGAPAPSAGAGSAEAAPRDAAVVLAESDSAALGDDSVRVNPHGAALASVLVTEPLGRVELVADPNAGLFSAWPELTFKRDEKAPGLAYTATRADGLKITKEFLPGPDKVLPRIRVTALNPTKKPIDVGSWTLTVGPGLGTIDSEKKDNAKVSRAIGLTPEDESQHLHGRIDKLKAGPNAGPYRWIGIDNRYFLAALLPPADRFEPVTAGGPPPSLALTAKPVTLAAGQTTVWEIPYYLGPKGHTWLSRYGLGLERSIDFGFFAWLGRKMLDALVILHGLLGNWGWSIIALTMCLQLLLAPLTYKSLKAAAAMRKLQPQIAKMQERYKDDPTRLNTEMMGLYKKEGANPLGGCLPMLLQMPIFLSLYNALRNSWELHGVGWMFWIRDLSAKDPYYVLPLVMGGLMFAQSKLNPPAGDPAQQQMMMFMPVIFTVMFLNFPSGLVLYWLTNSLVSTVLQLSLRSRLEAA
jgi:YidC/Oxa1 family membrane protein insertase